MNRRDVLLLRKPPTPRVYELACQRLYMQYLDTQRPSTPSEAHDGYRLGEPEPHFDTRRPRELFDGIRRELAGAQVLRIVEREWLVDSELKQHVDDLIGDFRASGGRVEFGSPSPPSSPDTA